MRRVPAILLFLVLAVSCSTTGQELAAGVQIVSQYCNNCAQSGQIENGNNVSVDIDLVLEFLDGAGSVLGTDTAWVADVKPGQVRNFHGAYPGDPDLEDGCRIIIRNVYVATTG
jgi:hypothetical protein